MQKNQFQHKKIAWDFILTHTNTRASALYTIHTDEQTSEQMWLSWQIHIFQ